MVPSILVTSALVSVNKAKAMPTIRPKRTIRDVKSAAKSLIARRSPKAIRALPKIVKRAKRSAAVKPTATAARIKAIESTTQTVAKSPTPARKLAKPARPAASTTQDVKDKERS